MKIHLTEQSVEILLTEEEVQTLVEGKEVIGSPSTAFLSPFGQRIVIVRQAGLEEIRSREGGKEPKAPPPPAPAPKQGSEN